jgi:diguanylate cyclase (GGDEF)-like protein/PAS domain S-box-containing protein
MEAGAPSPRDLRPVASACGTLAVALGAAIVAGWSLDAAALTRVAPGLPSAMPNAGFMFFGCGVVLLVESGSARSRAALGASTAAGLFVTALAAATLVEHVADVSLGIDTRIGSGYADLLHPGRPATHTATGFLLLGGCLLLTRWRSRLGAAVTGVLGAGAAATVGMAVAGYLVDLKYLYGTAEVHGMSVHTAAGLVVVLTGVFALRPEAPPASWFARRGAGAAVASRLMVPALALPFLAGALAQAGAGVGLYSERFALALLVVLFAATIQGLIFVAARAADGHEQIREALERGRGAHARRFTMLASRAPVGIFETDAAGRVTYVNDRWTEITGMAEADFIGGGSVLHLEDQDEIRAEWAAAARAGRDFRRELRFLRPDGQTRWVSVHASALRDDDNRVTGFIGSVLDVTERREGEERTGLVVDRIAEAVNIIGADGSILHSNDAARAILEDLRQRHDAGPVSELTWGTIDTDGRPVPNDELPAEVTRTTGNQVDERVLGFPDASGDVRWLRISTRTLTAVGPPFSVVVSFVDVTAARRDAARLAEARRRFELAFDHAPIGVVLVSLEGHLLQVNAALRAMIGYTEEELLATTFQELSVLNDLTPHTIPLRQVVEGELASHQMEMRYRHKDGSEIWALTTVALVRSDDGKPLHYIGQILDVTERRSLERQLRHQAEHDALTGVANRRVFAAELARQLARERRYGGESSLLMVDLDGFKEINDGMGHAAGDLVLQAVGYLLTARVRDTDLVARLGGDEFAVLLPETPREGAEVLAIDIVQAVRELSVDIGDGREASVTASVGVASSGELPDAADEDTLLAAADVAMYEAKRAGRDGHAVHLDAG